MDTISKNHVIDFKRFLEIICRVKEQDLIIIKGHLLIEEQIYKLIKERINNPLAIEAANLECSQAICLAQSFFPVDFQPWLWSSLKKFNSLRNYIAHNIELKGLDHKIKDFIESFPSTFKKVPDNSNLELTIWSLFVAVLDISRNQIEQISQFPDDNSEENR